LRGSATVRYSVIVTELVDETYVTKTPYLVCRLASFPIVF